MSTPTLESLAAEIAELREKFSRERGTWPGPEWMREITEGLTTLSMEASQRQFHADRQFAAVLERQNKTNERLDRIERTLERLVSAIERLGGPGGPGTPGPG